MKNNNIPVQANFVKENPFMVNRENRNTSIKCPNCKNGLLFIKYSNSGGDFVCSCGFLLK
jgi:ssDNA-binding Zn-finger/Zn-ribbon topoisomerase 1